MKLSPVSTLLIFVLLFSHTKAQEFNLEASIEQGSTLYSSKCSSCHMVNGNGIQGVYPPLTGADSLMKDIPRLVASILEGVEGTTKVNGVEYNGTMQSYSLTDKEVADLLNYMRNSWGNEGEVIVPVEIQHALEKENKEQ